MNYKLKTYEEIEKISDDLRNLERIIVTTNGSFDILHSAHVKLLERARNKGDSLIVLLNSDDSIRKLKGDKRPILGEKDRAYLLSGLSCVNYVVIFSEDNPLRLLEIIKPHIHIKGGSYILEKIKEERELLERWGGKLKLFSLEDGYSSTRVIEEILRRYNAKN